MCLCMCDYIHGGYVCMTGCAQCVCCERVCECSMHVKMWWSVLYHFSVSGVFERI